MKNIPRRNDHHLKKISFYIVAHADDWQLFMQPNIYKDLVSPGCKVVIIIVTAGDSGRSEIFCRAREEGSKSSLRYCLAPFVDITEADGKKKFNTHDVAYSMINNTTSYFLRLPDGNLDGCGFAKYNFQSLAKLKENKIESIEAIDNSATYKSWADFTLTLEAILTHEIELIHNIHINYPNPDKVKNCDDHLDHLMVGKAMENLSIQQKSTRFLFTGYDVSAKPEMLSPTELFWKTGAFAAYEKTVYDICGYSTLAENPNIYKNWCTATSKFETLDNRSL